MTTKAQAMAAQAASTAAYYADKVGPSQAAFKADQVLALAAKVDKLSDKALPTGVKAEALDAIYAAYATLQAKESQAGYTAKDSGHSKDAMDYAVAMGHTVDVLADVHGEDEYHEESVAVQTDNNYEGYGADVISIFD